MSPREPLRAIRISAEIWTAAQAEAKARDEALSAAIRKFLIRYAARKTSR